MSEAAILNDNEAPGYVVSRQGAPNFVEGRRSFFEYIDLGTQEASEGKIRIQVTKAKQGLVEPTGWHKHLCDGQFVYMLDGYLDLAFADGTVRLESGDSIYIPGGVAHNETETSDTFDLIEISIPAKMDTEPCDPPAGMPA
ncbi:MAG: cupin domain-containing protein [Alphaproteobacteria bacterium]|jgi:quercetin dioxygenase-like cupin family protein|nr:cupin domain-containing protein [Alphaproteobacteria bacterium]